MLSKTDPEVKPMT